MKSRIAVLHNYLDNIGGAEIVALTLAREFSADVYTTNVNTQAIISMGFSDVLPRIKSIGNIPKNPPYRQQKALHLFRKLDLKNKYDIYIIAGDWAMSAAVNNKPNIWYVHSPLNELWAFKDKIKKRFVPWHLRLPYELWVQYNRYLTKKYAKHVTRFVCNSKNTQKRIRLYYNKNAEVVYPPIHIKVLKKIASKDKNYFLSVNRLVRTKRVEMQIEAFRKMPHQKLIIVGSYEKGNKHFENYLNELTRNLPSNVQIKSFVSDAELAELYHNCKGFITTAENEDFGMTAVEAMAYGKALIAPAEGGYLETVVHGKTGVLIKKISFEKIIDAVASFDSYNFSQAICKKQAKKFGNDSFVKKMKTIIKGF